MPELPHVVTSAPGKLVLTGEYAVLCGAPAIIAAIDRRVRVDVRPADSGGWRVVSTGFVEELAASKADVFGAGATSSLGLVSHFLPAETAPEHARLRIDSSDCYDGRTKLGVGSSAAVTVALAAALSNWRGTPLDLDTLIDGHRAFQGGGSGLDIATSYLGGIVRFQDRKAETIDLPTGIHLGFVFTGSSTRTLDLVGIFDNWRTRTDAEPTLQAFLMAAENVADCTGNAQAFMDRLRQYIDSLSALDGHANIGIFGPGHQRASALASQLGVLYKPCGAGGGDCGVAIATDRDAIDRFLADASFFDLVPLSAEVAPDGVTVATR